MTGGQVFLAYVREDSERVDRLQAQLEGVGLQVWRDVKDLWPGDVWKLKIQEMIESGTGDGNPF
ncbi:MAG: toll/interleukin-1 receptor domain-containing protein [Acidimicrobiia bacterium]